MYKSIKNLTLIFFFLCSTASFAKGEKALLQQAEAFFQEQNYEQALQIYLNLEPQYTTNWQLNYNIGNVYVKLFDLPNAILYYERAAKLNPNNKDIRENIKICNARLTAQSYPLTDFFLWSWIKTAAGWCLPTLWAVITLVILAFCSVSFCFYYFAKSKKALTFYLFIFFAVLALTSFSLSLVRTITINEDSYAIIFDANGLIPDQKDNEQTFGRQKKLRLYNGQKVKIVGHQDGFLLIKTLEGNNAKVSPNCLQTI